MYNILFVGGGGTTQNLALPENEICMLCVILQYFSTSTPRYFERVGCWEGNDPGFVSLRVSVLNN